MARVPGINPFRTAVPFWGQASQILSNLSPNRDCGPKKLSMMLVYLHSSMDMKYGYESNKAVRAVHLCEQYLDDKYLVFFPSLLR